MVHHGMLLDKLAIYLHGTTILKFFQSFLENREQRVHFNGNVSRYGILKAGVPQGSVLGPLLFCLFINDLPIYITNKKISCDMFADDTTLSASGKSIEAVTNALQKSLDKTHCWCLSNRMVLNPSKTKYMIITSRQKHQLRLLSLSLSLDTVPIQRVSEPKVLGVIIDEQLDWNSHTNKICQKLSSNLFLLSKLRHFVDTQTCKIFFNAHILSHINYASTLWDGCSEANFKRVNSLYRRASKLMITNKSLSTDEKMKMLDFLPLRKHLELNKCVLMKKISDGRVPSYLSSLFRYSTHRGRKYFFLPQPRIDLFKTSLSYSGVTLWNSLPDDIQQIKSLPSFKNKLHNIFRCHST